MPLSTINPIFEKKVYLYLFFIMITQQKCASFQKNCFQKRVENFKNKIHENYFECESNFYLINCAGMLWQVIKFQIRAKDYALGRHSFGLK